MALQQASSGVDGARAVAALARDCADETERNRRLSQPVVEAMVDAGLMHMLVPASLGGGEVDPLTMLRLIETVSAGDGAAGWCVMIGATSAAGGVPYLREDVARAIFEASRRNVTGGAVAPSGVARPVAGGYRVAGRWGWGSGLHHCAWVHASCVVMDGDAPRTEHGGPMLRTLLVPAEQVEILDTWDVSGLRGTGSHDFVVRDAFVPEERAYSFMTGTRSFEGALYRIPTIGLMAAAVAAVPLGIARGAIDALIDLAQAKVPTGSRRTLRERASTAVQVAEAEATLGAGAALLREAVADIWDTVQANDTLSIAQRARLRLAASHAAVCATRAVDLMHAAGGATANFSASPLQRAFRDVHAATGHVLIAPIHYEAAGRHALGLEIETMLL